MDNVDPFLSERKSQKSLTHFIGPPDDFDPARFPILAKHWFRTTPAPINGRSAALVADPPFHHQLEALCARGARLPVELLAELAIEYDIEAAIRKKLRRYLDIPDDALDLAGARQLPPLTIHAAHGGQP